MWNFFPLTHVTTEQDDRQGQEAPSYLDTGQMVEEETSPRNITDQEESCNRESGSSEDGNQEAASGDDERGASEGEKGDPPEPMEEGGSCEGDDKSSTGDTAVDKDCKPTETSNTLTVRSMSEPMGLKSPLHRSLCNLPGEEATESLCVEVENESLSERLQDVESELEFLGYGREGALDRDDGRPRAKRRRLQVSSTREYSEMDT